MENSIWTEDPILRCQYSPHYLCSLLIQGRGEADVEQYVSFENAKQTSYQEVTTCGTNIHFGQQNNQGQIMDKIHAAQNLGQ